MLKDWVLCLMRKKIEKLLKIETIKLYNGEVIEDGELVVACDCNCVFTVKTVLNLNNEKTFVTEGKGCLVCGSTSGVKLLT